APCSTPTSLFMSIEAPSNSADPAADLIGLSRRTFLGSVTTALAGVGLSQLLLGDLAASGLSAETSFPHFRPKAKRVLQIFCPGAASHMDLWEHKPALDKYHGQPLPG